MTTTTRPSVSTSVASGSGPPNPEVLLVDRETLPEAQVKGDVVGANTMLSDAYETDVRPQLAELRECFGVPTDPLRASTASAERITRMTERVGISAGW